MTTEILRAFVSEPDEDRRWEMLRNFVPSDIRVARGAGEEGLDARDPRTRQVAADILGVVASLDPSSSSGIADALMPRVGTEQDVDALDALIVSLGHAGDTRARSTVLTRVEHPNEKIRLAVAWTLPCLDLDDRALEALRRLSADRDDDVRNWATFALAQSDATDEATVEALASRTDDEHDDTRAEGIFGLARRKDPRAKGLIDKEMASPTYGSLIDEALEELDV